jgi:propanol-preferring alcohol dehydrogenase
VKALVLNRLANLADNPQPLQLTTLPDPVPQSTEILVKVTACGVCHTELDARRRRVYPLC